ncbi:hypothetical protein ACFOMD_01665 [Sphingoaurantiacus capsulatus]|uniref:Uncharacterized protein n=1 Tax=Sphingoaurantiacus capsulatus TaxID=1771310 RepID=A0ABV7X6A9_9SPHN
MAILLPAEPVPQSWTPRAMDWGGELVPVLGGETQRLNRLGDRFAVEVVLTPTQDAAQALAYISRLRRGRREGARMPFPQLNLPIGNPGELRVHGSGQAGSSLTVRGATTGYGFREGQFFSLVHDGRRYLHSVATAATAPVGGVLTLAIEPMLRVSPGDGDLIEMAAPMIEGFVGGNEQGWTVDIAGTIGLSFILTERG